jgi:hypothetical protein
VDLHLGDPLAIYLNDHLAGATGGLELARRSASNNRANAYGPVLEELADEIAADRDALQDAMARLGVGRDRVKLLAAWGAEKAGRLKLNGSLLGYSPLSRLEELEVLLLGVEGKQGLWRVLRQTYGDDPRLAAVDLDALSARAQSQQARLERLRLAAADDALLAGRG